METSPAKEPEDTPGWRTAIGYGMVSALMLLLAVAAYGNYIGAQQAQMKAAYERAQVTRALTDELRTLLEKQNSLQQAREQVAVLGREIAALPTVLLPDKARLSGTVSTVTGQLDTVQSLIDRAQGIITQFQAQRFGQKSYFNLVQSAFADTLSSNVVPPEVKIGVAVLALLVIFLVILYCLWMIARPTAPISDKKWAKELLNKQLVFLGGSLSGL